MLVSVLMPVKVETNVKGTALASSMYPCASRSSLPEEEFKSHTSLGVGDAGEEGEEAGSWIEGGGCGSAGAVNDDGEEEGDPSPPSPSPFFLLLLWISPPSASEARKHRMRPSPTAIHSSYRFLNLIQCTNSRVTPFVPTSTSTTLARPIRPLQSAAMRTSPILAHSPSSSPGVPLGIGTSRVSAQIAFGPAIFFSSFVVRNRLQDDLLLCDRFRFLRAG